ncbi:hypothetical protein HanIR_Chr01g0018351 [Helianthus annuus]|nr:hypothetical protein HanIR_Chr01g0018351 [Helianthus annuus]
MFPLKYSHTQTQTRCTTNRKIENTKFYVVRSIAPPNRKSKPIALIFKPHLWGVWMCVIKVVNGE